MRQGSERFWQRFWSLYVIGRQGIWHTLKYVFCGLLQLMGIMTFGILMLGLIAWLAPAIISFSSPIIGLGILAVMLCRVLWRIFLSLFR